MSDFPGEAQTAPEALAFWAARRPGTVALISPGREPVTYCELHDAVVRLASALGARGLGRQDAIALVFPEGLELCLALLAAMSVGIAVPLPWPSPEPEYRKVLSNRRVRAVVAAPEAVAALRGSVGPRLPVIAADPGTSGRAQEMRLRGSGPRVGQSEPAVSGDFAVILRSSGTTGRPKLVPRTHLNLMSFCRDSVEARAITPADRGLSLGRSVYSMGLHALLSAIFAGASLVVVPTLDRRAVSGWLRAYRPTFVSTTPSVLRAVAAERDMPRGTALRGLFVTSAPIPYEEAERVEAVWGAPILNMYGMTEATGIAGERYPLTRRVPGSVGPAWCDVQVVAESGERVGATQIGEIVVRGPRVSPGYLDDPEASATAFLDGGWLRTGDLGFVDEAGYVHLRGRLGEIINRGGEKIDPGEVDAVLLAHPAVRDGAAFGVPDARLGEDVVAAVVLKPGMAATARDLRSWMLDRLLPHKAPRRIWFVDALPRTGNGKVQRGELARRWHEDER